MASLTSTPESTTRTEFTFFPKMPTELQLKIWKLTMEPRVIEVQWSIQKETYFTDAPLPVALNICHESRVEALKYYSIFSANVHYDSKPVQEKSFGSESNAKQSITKRGTSRGTMVQRLFTRFTTYINYKSDTICLVSHHFRHSEGLGMPNCMPIRMLGFLYAMDGDSSIAEKVQFLAMDKLWGNTWQARFYIRRMMVLEELGFVVGCGCCMGAAGNAQHHRAVGKKIVILPKERAVKAQWVEKESGTVLCKQFVPARAWDIADKQTTLKEDLARDAASYEARGLAGERKSWDDLEINAVLIKRKGIEI